MSLVLKSLINRIMSIIKKIQAEFIAKGPDLSSREAGTWLRKKIKELNIKQRTLLTDHDRLRRSTYIGKMYFFFYDPKTKQQLPYYDIFPLVIPLERHNDGFLGLNLHYVAPKIRMQILDTLYKTASNNKMDDTTRMKVNYNIITSIAKSRFMKPCIKKYLTSHIASRFVLVSADEWHFAAMLPFEAFQKLPKTKVFIESRKQYQ